MTTEREMQTRRRTGATGAIAQRPTTEPEKIARAREKVEQAASNGEDPRQVFGAADLKWAGFREAELDALTERAAEVQAAKADRRDRAESSRELGREIQRVEAELLEAERQQRREKAEGIARERLGL